MTLKFNNSILQFLIVVFSAGQVTAQINVSDTLPASFENIVWNADEVIGLKNFNYGGQFNVISLDTVNPQNPYGNITEFKDNKFTSHNQGFCGNECRAFVTGTYKVDGNKIDLFINTIVYAKDCAGTPAQVINKPFGTFYWVKNEYGLHFLKDLRDKPNLDAVKKLKSNLPAFRYITSSQLIVKFISIYHRFIKIVPDTKDEEYMAWANTLENWRAEVKNWESEAEKYKITGEEEYKEYKKIVMLLDSILADTQSRHRK